MTRFTIHAGLALMVLVAVGCATEGRRAEHGHDHAAHARHARAGMSQDVPLAVAVLHPTQDSEVRGVVLFKALEGNRVQVNTNIVGLPPNSRHGFHIHEFGDATSADGSSAGGHYNPEGHPHGLPNGKPTHAGDMGNIEADGQGRVRIERILNNVTLAGKTNPILGRGVVVHADPDDGGQPSGNAGGRVAVGVIGVARPSR